MSGKTASTVSRGGCLCGGVRYEVTGHLKDPVACHCSQCGRTSGNFAAMSGCRNEHLVLAAESALRWFRSSPNARRGFCERCGSNLFWKGEDADETYVAAGTLDRPTGVTLSQHIYVASKSDFYELTDALPKKDEW